jgi:hypothetical protein
VLAVVQAGAYISKTECGFARYLEMYRERRGGLLEEYKNQKQKVDDYEWTVYTTWTISYEKLSKLAATFLDICGFLHHDGIMEEIFRNAAANVMTMIRRVGQLDGGLGSLRKAKEFLVKFQTATSAWDGQKFLDVIGEVRSYSLIDFQGPQHGYSIHPLVKMWIATRVLDAASVHACAKWILGMSVNRGNDLEGYLYRRGLVAHIDAAWDRGILEHVEIAASFYWVYSERGRWTEAEVLQVQVMETRKQVLGEKHPDTLSSMENLASTYWNQGHWKEAEVLQVQVMETTKQVLGEKHPDTLTSMGNLASTYRNQGHWKEAEVLEVQVMERFKQVLGEKHPDTLTSMANLACTYQKQGHWTEAEVLQVQVMETSKQVLGEKHPDTLTSMANLACTYQKQGHWKKAEVLEVQVMETLASIG